MVDILDENGVIDPKKWKVRIEEVRARLKRDQAETAKSTPPLKRKLEAVATSDDGHVGQNDGQVTSRTITQDKSDVKSEEDIVTGTVNSGSSTKPATQNESITNGRPHNNVGIVSPSSVTPTPKPSSPKSRVQFSAPATSKQSSPIQPGLPKDKSPPIPTSASARAPSEGDHEAFAGSGELPVRQQTKPATTSQRAAQPTSPTSTEERRSKPVAAPTRAPPNVLSSDGSKSASAKKAKVTPMSQTIGGNQQPAARMSTNWGNNIAWYAAVTLDSRNNDVEATKMARIKEPISKCSKPDISKARLAELYEQIREQLHAMRHIQVDERRIKKSRLLDLNGLPALFEGSHEYPYDIRADGKELAMKWRHSDFNSDILRYIDFPGGKKLSENRPRFRADHPGEGDLVNGQWFPNQLCTVRDGAHGSAQAGIYGHKGQGAFSVVMAGSYDDVDDGNFVKYCGAKFDESMVDSREASSTRRLLENLGHPERPVRLIRAAKLGTKYAPALGYRYDGLYEVFDKEDIEASAGRFRFHMRRLTNQDPIRYEGTERRPTQQEIDQLNLYQQKLKGIGA